MKSLGRILTASAAIVAVLLGASLLLPRDWRVERDIVVRAPASAIFPYLNSLRLWREWAVWYQRDPAPATEYSGPAVGVGATARWTGPYGRGALIVLQSDKDRLVEYRILFNGGESEMGGRLMLVAEGDITHVVWRARGASGANPLSRYAALLWRYRIGNDFEQSLARLRERVEALR